MTLAERGRPIPPGKHKLIIYPDNEIIYGEFPFTSLLIAEHQKNPHEPVLFAGDIEVDQGGRVGAIREASGTVKYLDPETKVLLKELSPEQIKRIKTLAAKILGEFINGLERDPKREKQHWFAANY